MRWFRVALVVAAGLLLWPLSGRAQSTISQAFAVARAAVAPAIQTHVVSIYGIGTPNAIAKWYIIFYDPSIPSHGRAVLVANGQVVKTYAANGGVIYRSDLTFDPSRLTPEGPALAATQAFAARKGLVYDSVRALLKQTNLNRPFRWRIELMDDNRSRGDVYINALDSSVAAYSPAGSSPPETTTVTTSTTSTTTTASQPPANDDGNFGNDVKRTFLGIGGDLQEFFTGERTVDKQ